MLIWPIQQESAKLRAELRRIEDAVHVFDLSPHFPQHRLRQVSWPSDRVLLDGFIDARKSLFAELPGLTSLVCAHGSESAPVNHGL